ncbi:hypothetical protein RF11_02847 [Thelohanellus kitauei]|uniref:Uncharacterized protein n=1 Tax=Thelohanellus kitauei TaxID=669202 RepID=A0A0C2IBL9_THEKT|nr:hypothetical protein RF11_02847 [Thelohanellus kitauei]
MQLKVGDNTLVHGLDERRRVWRQKTILILVRRISLLCAGQLSHSITICRFWRRFDFHFLQPSRPNVPCHPRIFISFIINRKCLHLLETPWVFTFSNSKWLQFLSPLHVSCQQKSSSFLNHFTYCYFTVFECESSLRYGVPIQSSFISVENIFRFVVHNDCRQCFAYPAFCTQIIGVLLLTM